MARIIDIKPVFNKINKQTNLSLPKSKMPKKLREMISKDPTSINKIRIRIEGFE